MVKEKKRRCHLVLDYRQNSQLSFCVLFHRVLWAHTHTHAESNVWRLRRYKRSKKENELSKRVRVYYANAHLKRTNREGFRLCACSKQWVTQTNTQKQQLGTHFCCLIQYRFHTLYFIRTCIWKMLAAHKPIQIAEKKNWRIIVSYIVSSHFAVLFLILCFVASYFILNTSHTVCFADSYAFTMNS